MYSLRRRVILAALIGTSLVLLIAGVTLYWVIRSSTWSAFDAGLAGKAQTLASLVEQEDDDIEFEFEEAVLPHYQRSRADEYFQIGLADGRILKRSEGLNQEPMDWVNGTAERPGSRFFTLSDGRVGRLVGFQFIPRQDDDDGKPDPPQQLQLVVWRATNSTESEVALIGLILIAVGGATVAVISLILAWVVDRGLRPVDNVAGQIADVGESDLAVRIDPGGAPKELLPVVARLNELLVRLQTAFERERRFTADVAHELRTPVAGLRSTLEVALSKPRDSEAYQASMRQCLTISEEMNHMIENLLGLARAEAKLLEVHREPFDFAGLVRECWKPFAGAAAEKALNVDWQLRSPSDLNSDKGKLQLVLQNILGNAVAYVDKGGRVSVRSASTDGSVVFEVLNTGSSIAAEDVDRVYERFWRGDASRAQPGRHCGLGLPLCKSLMEILDGEIVVTSEQGGEFKVTIRIPSRSSAAQQD